MSWWKREYKLICELQIIEEFSAGAEERMDTLNGRIDQLDAENKELKKELNAIRVNRSSDGADGALT